MGVSCKICGYEAQKSLQAHINNVHSLSKAGYEALYPGHSFLSKEFYTEISEKNKEQASKLEWRSRVSDGIKTLWRDPIYRKNHLEAIKKGQNTPEAKENHRKGQANYLAKWTEQDKEKNRVAIIQSWKDPVKRSHRVEGLQKAHGSEKCRKNHSEAMKKFLAIPENLEIRKKKLKETWAEPENREKILELSKIGLKAANSPEGLRNRRLANLRPEVKKKRSEIAKLNTYKRMINKDKYSKLNRFLEEKMNGIGLFPKREYPLGPYAVDFCFPEEKLVIEADGDFWHANPEFLKERNTTVLYPLQKRTIALDKAKNTYLKNHGWNLLRFWERDIKNRTENCLFEIKNLLNRDKQLCQ